MNDFLDTRRECRTCKGPCWCYLVDAVHAAERATIQAAQAFVHARCLQHRLYTDGAWCAGCYDAHNFAEAALRDAVAKMEAP